MNRQRFRETENIDEEQEKKCAAGNHAPITVEVENGKMEVCAYCGEELA